MGTEQNSHPESLPQPAGQSGSAHASPEGTPKVSGASQQVLVALSVLASGLGIGVLVGLSVTPVIGSVVGVAVALIASLLSLSQDVRLGWNRDGHPREVWLRLSNTVALSSGLFIVGLVLGSLQGIYWRTHNTFGVVVLPSTFPSKPGSQDYLLAALQSGYLGQLQPSPMPTEKPAAPLPPGFGVLFSDSTDGGCSDHAGKLSLPELLDRLVRIEPRLRQVLDSGNGGRSRDDLVALYNTFVCAHVALSRDEVRMIQTNRAYGKAHPHPLVAKLSQTVMDPDLLDAVVETVFGPPQ